MQRRITNSHKAGASNPARPDPSSAGSRRAAVSDPRAKLRALFDVLGHSIARFPDGRTVLVTPDALKIINPVHGAFSA